jgi:hypothetical protein
MEEQGSFDWYHDRRAKIAARLRDWDSVLREAQHRKSLGIINGITHGIIYPAKVTLQHGSTHIYKIILTDGQRLFCCRYGSKLVPWEAQMDALKEAATQKTGILAVVLNAKYIARIENVKVGLL